MVESGRAEEMPPNRDRSLLAFYFDYENKIRAFSSYFSKISLP